jgi:hypothetical protein
MGNAAPLEAIKSEASEPKKDEQSLNGQVEGRRPRVISAEKYFFTFLFTLL